jgi:exo-beta-1,3-glucanase (GH17 family)
MPSSAPKSLDGWWCDANTEYGYVGFSYEVTACQSASQLMKDFKDIRNTFDSRYVRLYGACDKAGFYDDVVNAAWANTLGVHALVWFGFDNSKQWISRQASLVKSLHSNPKAKFVTRVVQFGSEPLFDGVLSLGDMVKNVNQLKASLMDVNVPVTVSELAYGYQKSQGSGQDLLDVLDSINIHMLPFFSQHATTGKNAWSDVLNDLNFFISHGKTKKIPQRKMYMDENGWPSVQSDGVQRNSHTAIADVSNEQQYYELLDSKCSWFKAAPGGGIAWFAHLYNDDQEPGYGIYTSGNKAKFAFKPRTHC